MGGLVVSSGASITYNEMRPPYEVGGRMNISSDKAGCSELLGGVVFDLRGRSGFDLPEFRKWAQAWRFWFTGAAHARNG